MDLKMPATKLDIDESILSRTLKINNEDDDLEQLFNNALAERNLSKASLPYKIVKPKPGFCVKTRNIITSQKVFLNICHTDVIPKPVEVSESELTKILESDEPSNFRVPMSIGEGHEEIDKSGQSCMAYDIAVNTTFLSKVEGSLLFQTFLLTAAMEGLEDKYNLELDKNGWTALRNRKCFGSIQNHRIEQREEKPFVQEIPKPSQLESSKKNMQPLVEEISLSDITSKAVAALHSSPKFALARTKAGVKFLLGSFSVPCEQHFEDVVLSVSKDSIAIEGLKGRCISIVKLPYSVDPTQTKNVYNKKRKILSVFLPLA